MKTEKVETTGLTRRDWYWALAGLACPLAAVSYVWFAAAGTPEIAPRLAVGLTVVMVVCALGAAYLLAHVRSPFLRACILVVVAVAAVFAFLIVQVHLPAAPHRLNPRLPLGR